MARIPFWHSQKAATNAAYAADAARAADADTVVINEAARAAAAATEAADTADAIYAARSAATIATEAATDAVSGDLTALLALNLGEPGTAGEPIRWDDPRLGPLWPDGPPAWHVEAEAACRELEAKLRQLALPVADEGEGEASESLRAQAEAWAWLDDLRNEGKLEPYRGEFVIAAGREVFAHDWNLLVARADGEKAAGERGVATDRLIDYFVPAE